MTAKSASPRRIRCHNPVPDFEVSDERSDLSHLAAEFVPQHYRRPAGPMAFYDVYVRAANTGGNDFKFHFVRGGMRFGPIRQFHVPFAGLCLDNRFHLFSLSTKPFLRRPLTPDKLEQIFFRDHYRSLQYRSDGHRHIASANDFDWRVKIEETRFSDRGRQFSPIAA